MQTLSTMTAKFLILALSGVFCGLAQAEGVSEVSNKAYFICKNKKEVRTVRVQVDGSGVCTTYYSKQGTEKAVGSGKNHDSCIGFMNNVKTNLEGSNWTCRDISATKITSLE